jgi:subtilisin family serine protease
LKPLITVVSIIAILAVSASAAPVPRTHDRLTRPDLGDRSQKAGTKVSSRLRAKEGWVGPPTGPLVAADPPRSPEGKLQVYVDCSPLGVEQLDALERAGLTLDGVEPSQGRVRGRIDAAALDQVADFAWVHAIRPVDPAVVRAGSTTTEGDAAARADLLRAQGLDGNGVVVGVISDGVNHVQDAQQSGDLPAVTVPSGGCRRGSGDEGTALLEIVHDVAPGARLLFAGPADSFEMVQAVQCLTAAGADVIVDDLGFFGEPYFQDGPVAAAVRTAVRAGVSYHSSAGNEARQHLEQDFVATPSSTLHDFAGGAGDNTNSVVVPPGGTLTCLLQWNDPFGTSANDYDLFLLDQNLNVVTQSIDPQVGAQDPIEAVSVLNRGSTAAVANVVIDRFGAAQPRRLELFCLGASSMEHVIPVGSIFGHAALAEVVSVAAIDVADPGFDRVESFSSRGPARVDFPVREDRAKPDLAGFDGVSISNAGGFPACPPFCSFFGTSAASPHTAGVAALLLQLNPSMTPRAVQTALHAGAADIGSVGFDDASGFGRLDALASADAAVVPPPIACGLGSELAVVLPLLAALRRRRQAMSAARSHGAGTATACTGTAAARSGQPQSAP